MSRPILRRTHAMGYDVVIDGVVVGSLTKHRKTYNLRRLIVDEWWTARPEGGASFGGWDTRREALAALLEVLAE